MSLYRIDFLGSTPVLEGVALVRGSWKGEGRCLFVINVTGISDRIDNASGLEEITTGAISFGAGGCPDSSKDVLAIADADAEFCLSSKYASIWYFWTGEEWRVESPEMRKVRKGRATCLS